MKNLVIFVVLLSMIACGSDRSKIDGSSREAFDRSLELALMEEYDHDFILAGLMIRDTVADVSMSGDHKAVMSAIEYMDGWDLEDVKVGLEDAGVFEDQKKIPLKPWVIEKYINKKVVK